MKYYSYNLTPGGRNVIFRNIPWNQNDSINFNTGKGSMLDDNKS